MPDIELQADVDMGAFAAMRAASRSAASVTALLARACALSLRAVPRANAAYRDGRFELYSRVNVGVAVPSDRSYAMPTLFDADRKSAVELSDELRVLAARAAAGELTPPEQSGATFTLANVGATGVARSSIAITPPHAAAVCAGSIREAPVVREGVLAAGLAMTLTLVCDHRILYGATAGRFLDHLTNALAHPIGLERE